ncbi:hypothetical protein MVEG_01574 [Podila verticillata NRRL 6337]|nr:hypothetical protein MVEG_01574 [Podila verticillata NRRL 6337]
MSDYYGFSMESLVIATQLMPRMEELVHILGQFVPGSSLGNHLKWKLYDGRPVSPFETDSTARVGYQFAGPTSGYDGQAYI